MMKHSVFTISLLFILGLSMFSCKSNISKEDTQALCPRNVYSRNGVETMYHYSFDTKEGVVDELSKKLFAVEKYDSLGNLIYYKGEHFPSLLGVDIVTYHYDIREELDLPWSTKYTYKMEYLDTIFTKASLFDDEGKYIARIEQHSKGNVVEDSVYVRDRLIFVSHIFKDTEGRDSVVLAYDNEFGKNLKLKEEERNTYVKNDTVLTQYYIRKSRDFLYNYNHKYETTKGVYVNTYNKKGQLLKGDYGGYVTTYTYDDRGFQVESVSSSDYRKTKHLSKNTYYDNGLLKNSYGYADMTICESYSEYEYDFYPYSKSKI